MYYRRLFIFVTFTIQFTVDCFAQENRKVYENLVFEGAGMRGIAYAGALSELEKNGLLKDIKRTGGTSSGAITALAYSINYTPEEIKHIIASTNFRKFNDGRFIFIGGIVRLNKNFGWYRVKRFERWLAELIQEKTGNADISFREMHAAGYKDLYVTATDLTYQQPVIFSFEHTPDIKIRDAVRMSMSIPLYFQPLLLDDANNVHTKYKSSIPLRVIVDGGFVQNFPIRLFDSTKYEHPGTPNIFFINPRTLAFRIDSEEQIMNDRSTGKLTPVPIKNLRSYIKAFYIIVVENLNRNTLTAEDWKRTVSISDGNVSPKVRKLRKSEVDKMIMLGTEGARHYLNESGVGSR